MAGKSFDASRGEDLDWDNLSNPVPLDRIDPEFPAHAAPKDLTGERSEIFPGAESEALADAAETAPQMPDRNPPSETPPNAPTLQMPARAEGGSTTFGESWPKDQAAIEDEFSRIRAKMEAEAESEKKAKLESDREEASQRDRLEQWMANARARLLKADADLTGPSGRIRIRKDHSPSLYRLAEMQKTIWVEGQATQADPNNPALRPVNMEKAPEGRPDPMATLSVPTEQFLTLDAPAPGGE